MSPSACVPVAFFGHGSPMNTLESNRHTEAWRALGATPPLLCVPGAQGPDDKISFATDGTELGFISMLNCVIGPQ